MDQRRQAQTIFIAMHAQAEMLDALLSEGALSIRSARPLFGNILLVTNAWESMYPEGRDLMSAVLQKLRAQLGIAENGSP
jgi:hypothetical protein